MSVPRHYEYDPIFPLGFHHLMMTDLELVCVEMFPLSRTRSDIMEGFRTFVQNLVDWGVRGELWVDGSFLTEKIDPKDIDVVLRCDGSVFDKADGAYRKAVAWVNENQKAALKCDSYTFFEYDEDDPLHQEGQWQYAWYLSRWGHSSIGEPKGIVVIRLDGTPT